MADLGLDGTSIAAALLHDAVEDTSVELVGLADELGAEVAAIVDGVTKLERVRFAQCLADGGIPDAATYTGRMKAWPEAGSVPLPERTIGAREFKDNCLQVLREVSESGEAVVVTRHKVPIARIMPPEPDRPVPIFGRCAGELRILGDITAPAFDSDEYDMESRPGRVLDPEGHDWQDPS